MTYDKFCFTTSTVLQIIAVATLIAVSVAAPQGGPDKDAVVTRYESDNIGVDGYNYA